MATARNWVYDELFESWGSYWKVLSGDWIVDDIKLYAYDMIFSLNRASLPKEKSIFARLATLNEDFLVVLTEIAFLRLFLLKLFFTNVPIEVCRGLTSAWREVASLEDGSESRWPLRDVLLLEYLSSNYLAYLLWVFG